MDDPSVTVREELLRLSDHVASRTLQRLAGLTDEEYWWSPVEGAWSARVEDGRFVVDWAWPQPQPPPFTTLAWRAYHLMACYAQPRNAEWLNLRPAEDPLADRAAQPVDAASAVALLERCQQVWHGYVEAVDEVTLADPLGSKAGPYAEATGADYVLHQIDEQIHHGAEIGLLRDLYRARHGEGGAASG